MRAKCGLEIAKGCWSDNPLRRMALNRALHKHLALLNFRAGDAFMMDHKRHGGGPGAGGATRGANGGRREATYAALDLGTNNCRLLVARPCNDGFRVVDSFSRIVRLGEGVSRTGKLSEPAIERAVGALRV